MQRTMFTSFPAADVHSVSKASVPQTSPAGAMLCEAGRPYLTDPMTGRRFCQCELVFPEGHHARHGGGALLPGGLKTLAVPTSDAPHGLDAAALYGPLLRGFPVRPGQPLAFDPSLAAHPYFLHSGFDGLGMRKAATRETTGPLKAWLHEHRKNPYPTKAEKIMLAIITKMTLTQVSTWFANARRRLKKESRLYSNNRDNDKDDDDDNDTDVGTLRDACDSDEDINVDVSDVSDTEDGAHTPATTTTTSTSTPSSSTTPPNSKPSPSSSASSAPLSPYPATPPLPRPVFPRPIQGLPSVGFPAAAVMPVVGTSNGVLQGVSHGGVVVTKASSHSRSTLSTAPSSASPAPAAPAARPRIWSISDLIHSERSDSAATAPTAAAASATDTTRVSDSSASRVNRLHETSHHGIHVSLPTPAVDMAHSSRHYSSLFVPFTHQALVTPATSLRPQISPRVIKRETASDTGSEECRPTATVAPSCDAKQGEISPQTEALDLQTKREDKGNKSKT